MRPEKEFLLQEIKNQIDRSQAMVMVKYNKLSPMASWKFGKMISSEKSHFEVVKKRVFLKAAEKSGISLDLGDFTGHIGVLFVEGDPLSATKILLNFSKENEDTLKILSGRMEGKVYSGQDMETLAKLPSLQEMRALILGLFVSPMSQTLSVIEQMLSGVAGCIENKSQTSS
jgi:large subunit ribosomal protein L10